MSIIQKIKDGLGIGPEVIAKSLPELRRSVITAEHDERMATLTKQWRELHDYSHKLYQPSQRWKALAWIWGVNSIEELDGDRRKKAELCVHLHHAETIQNINDSELVPRDRQIQEAIAGLIRELHELYRPVIEDETKRYSGELGSLFQRYGVAEAVEAAGPVRQLRAEHGQHACPVGVGVQMEPSVFDPWLA